MNKMSKSWRTKWVKQGHSWQSFHKHADYVAEVDRKAQEEKAKQEALFNSISEGNQ